MCYIEIYVTYWHQEHLLYNGSHAGECHKTQLVNSTLAQIMAWCLASPSHYLSQCWSILYVAIILNHIELWNDRRVNNLKMNAKIILCMCPANERWRYNVTSSLIGWAHSQNDPCEWSWCWHCTSVPQHPSHKHICRIWNQNLNIKHVQTATDQDRSRDWKMDDDMWWTLCWYNKE